jgi:hypothetical protein
MFIGIAVRYRAVSIQINGPKKVKSWKPTPTTEINHNPVILAGKLTDTFTLRKSKFETVRIV